MTAEPVAAPPEPPVRRRSGGDTVIRVAGVVVTVLATVLSGMLELFTTTWRLGGVPIGVSVPAAVLGNTAIAWFAVTTTGRRWAIGPPWVLWTLMMLAAAGARRTEGDFLIGGSDWVALVMILAGSLTFAVYAYRMILRGSVAARR
ncbi:hypothetical protein [Mangrovihabitans endophyticus]|uniref:Uncharacterized protein n=1 Tax=Mangrovihabitans endophyticus TaxID=1751298 RepID=A0A8J3C404_9ACTN|nr:hypothetical protein [Mangrovihabitans endophyticus]GGL04917.1 hypothetical protein GCM10012284_44400 [Mangrovihabitans endophyticus]